MASCLGAKWSVAKAAPGAPGLRRPPLAHLQRYTPGRRNECTKYLRPNTPQVRRGPVGCPAECRSFSLTLCLDLCPTQPRSGFSTGSPSCMSDSARRIRHCSGFGRTGSYGSSLIRASMPVARSGGRTEARRRSVTACRLGAGSESGSSRSSEQIGVVGDWRADPIQVTERPST